MTKEQFFGRCIGQEIKTSIGIDILDGVVKTGMFLRAYGNINPYDISDCQIIGRRIKDMTKIEKAECYSLATRKFPLNTISDHVTYINEEIINYLFDIGIFPDKYFDELKWVVEK